MYKTSRVMLNSLKNINILATPMREQAYINTSETVRGTDAYILETAISKRNEGYTEGAELLNGF